MYFEYRTTATHGVFLLDSNGKDIKITNSGPGGTALEDNVIGVILAFSFFAGSEEDPGEMAIGWQGSTRRRRVCQLKFRIGLLGSQSEYVRCLSFEL